MSSTVNSSSAQAEMLRRLDGRVASLAAISDPPEPGVTRMAFTPLEREAHALVAEWADGDGARVETDCAGNTTLVYREGEPYVLLGSHLDSVRHGGRYDGVIGVLAALEVARSAGASARHGVRVVVFSAEEGARFGQPCLGSSLATGHASADDLAALRDMAGKTALEAAREVDLDPGSCPAWVTAPAVGAYLELHIEQGSVLEREQVRLGVVDVIAGAARVDVEITGRAEHSGATPMRARHDALAAASELVLAVEAIGRTGRDGTATIGRLSVEPNGVTTIPGCVRAIVDIRNADAGRQQEMVRAVEDGADEIGARRAVACATRLISWRDPVTLWSWVRRALADACVAHRLPYRLMLSGPGHDAALVAMNVPAGMVFVATPNGLSHVPDEGCRTADVALGCEVMTDAIHTLDAQLDAVPEAVPAAEDRRDAG